MRGFISSTDWQKVFSEEDPENVCVQITEIIQTAMEQFIPSKTVTKKPGDKPWFDEKCSIAARKKRRLFRQLKNNNNPTNKQKFAEARHTFNQAEKQARRNYNAKLTKELTDNTITGKRWWRLVNSISGRAAVTDIPVIIHNNTAHITAREKAEVFCTAFAQKCHLQDASAPAPHIKQSTSCTIENITFKPKDINRLLKGLKPDKASGPDQIPTRVLKECSAELASPLCRLFSRCFSSGIFPSQWKMASVTPVHKKDSKADPSKYRPISLLSVISKVMEAAVNQQLQRYILRNNLISHRQFGFRPGHSTADLLNILCQTWNNCLDLSEEVCVIALDIQGAFDKVWHTGIAV